MSGTVVGSMYGADTLQLQRMFAELPKRIQTRVLRVIIGQSQRMVTIAEKGEAPRRSGLMAAALGASTTRTYGSDRSTKLFVAVGVRRGFRRMLATKARRGIKFIRGSRPERGEEGAANPALYLHLVTKGRKQVTARNAKALFDATSGKFLGKSVPASKANPFIQRAYDSVGSAVSNQAAETGDALIAAEAESLLR
jgi:hypothetical protein